MLHTFMLVIIDYQHLRMQNRSGAPQHFRPRAATVGGRRKILAPATLPIRATHILHGAITRSCTCIKELVNQWTLLKYIILI
jgi:hypothetical protein